MRAQGSIRVFRKPADGKDSVRYWLVLSADSVVWDGTPRPDQIYVMVMKQSGDSPATEVTNNLEAEGLSVLYYRMRNGQIAGDVLDIPTFPYFEQFNSKEDTAYVIMLLHNGACVDTRTIAASVKPADGSDGKDAVRYWLVLSSGAVVWNSEGPKPASVKIDVMKQVGDGEAVNVYDQMSVNGLEVKYVPYWQGVAVEEQGIDWWPWVSFASREVTAYVFILRHNGVIVDTQTVMSTVEKQGIQGCVYRVTEWAEGFDYLNDWELTDKDGIRYIDIVVVRKEGSSKWSDSKRYICKRPHTSTADNKPVAGGNAYWEEMNSMAPVYVPLLLADNAVITLMQSNQIVITDDDGNVTTGFSGSNKGMKVRIWAGSAEPDNAPFRVLEDGSFHSSKANITGEIKATSGQIAGFKISGDSLTNEGFNNDASIVFRNDQKNTFAAIGGNVLAPSAGGSAVARFENNTVNAVLPNVAMLLSAKNGAHNFAFLGTGNGILDGWIDGYRFSKLVLGTKNIIVSGGIDLSVNNRWIVNSTVGYNGVCLPRHGEVRRALEIGDSDAFAVTLTIITDLNSETFDLYGRNKKTNSSNATPWSGEDFPLLVHENNGNWDLVSMHAGDVLHVLLVYDPDNTQKFGDYSLKYTARILFRND